MVEAFHLIQPSKVIFGNGKIVELAPLAKSYGNDILLVTGKHSFLGSKHGEYLLNTFDLTGIRYHHVIIGREPSPEMIDHAVIHHRNHPIRLVIAVGGGSVLDAGKAISAMLFKTESVAGYLEGVGKLSHPGSKVPFMAIPTTSGTGSEATKNAVISWVGKQGFKRSLRHENFVPDIVILDPELTLSCSPLLTASSGLDCFTQLLESYLSTQSSSYTDALALEGLRSVKNAFVRAWKWGQDLEARAGMSYAAFLSGICLANAGLGLVHGFASSMGGLFHIPHGTLCGTLMAETNKVTVRKLRSENTKHPVLLKYATVGRLFAGEDQKTEAYYIDFLIQEIEEWTEMTGVQRLGKFGVHPQDLDHIVSLTGIKTHPVDLNRDELLEILSGRL